MASSAHFMAGFAHRIKRTPTSSIDPVIDESTLESTETTQTIESIDVEEPEPLETITPPPPNGRLLVNVCGCVDR